MLAYDALMIWPVIGGNSGKHFVEDAAKTVDITATVKGVTTRSLLRAHISRRSNNYPSVSEVLATSQTDRSSNTKICHHSLSICDQYVFWFYVSMDYVMPVRIVQRRTYLPSYFYSVVEGKLPFSA